MYTECNIIIYADVCFITVNQIIINNKNSGPIGIKRKIKH